ncbi:MAG: hypothetical protein ACRCUI_08425, partial [Polymorphobacter sp.]
RTLDAGLARQPPLAIVTGFEGKSTINRKRYPDAALIDWARRHGYVPVASPISRAMLWIRPPATRAVAP